ncbi:hypothetical protein QBC34DRAFT_374940 [Podospora aff. communis PSN243]|uniref:F-box domain-containing protein n=1 Tax=Podospora aff. communis PSN243 TaxID=3040156 RepID=A0AAV9H5F4_9PEZI|nr:hypothetical protein QBC34DRAFT_374940 [Podospora aff. communis PSN243]
MAGPNLRSLPEEILSMIVTELLEESVVSVETASQCPSWLTCPPEDSLLALDDIGQHRVFSDTLRVLTVSILNVPHTFDDFDDCVNNGAYKAARALQSAALSCGLSDTIGRAVAAFPNLRRVQIRASDTYPWGAKALEERIGCPLAGSFCSLFHINGWQFDKLGCFIRGVIHRTIEALNGPNPLQHILHTDRLEFFDLTPPSMMQDVTEGLNDGTEVFRSFIRAISGFRPLLFKFEKAASDSELEDDMYDFDHGLDSAFIEGLSVCYMPLLRQFILYDGSSSLEFEQFEGGKPTGKRTTDMEFKFSVPGGHTRNDIEKFVVEQEEEEEEEEEFGLSEESE